MGWMHFHEHDRNIENLSQFLCERKGQFNALCCPIVANPPLSNSQFLFEFTDVIVRILKFRRDGSKQNGIIMS